MKKRIIIPLVLILAAVAAWAAVKYYRETSDADIPNDEDYAAETSVYSGVKPTDDSPADDSEEVDFLADCRAVNPDVVAWLTIPDTAIDFPIVQTDDNEHYLHYSLEGKKSIYGVPFLDCRNSSDFSDFNSIIYGHNISNKYVFAGLLNFRNQSYFDEHPYAVLTTSDKIYRINFTSCLVIESDGFVYNVVFLSKKEKQVFVRDIGDKAVCKRDFPDGDLTDKNWIVLSTCSSDYAEARTVLIGYLEEYE